MIAAAVVTMTGLLLQAGAGDGAGSIRGRVVSAETGEGLRGARVIVTAQGPKEKLGRTAATEANGGFAIEKLPPGAYVVSVYKPGYRPAEGTPARIVLEAKQERTGLELKMHRPGVVTGMVRDAEGRPAAGARVAAYRVSWANGLRRAVRAESATSDDRGVYRIFDLEAGRYRIGAAAAPADLPEGDGEANPMAFYPAGSSLEEAAPVPVRWGQESGGIHLVLRGRPGFQVSGRVLDAAAGGPCGGCLVRAEAAAEADLSLEREYRTAPDGGFRIRNLPPGAYRIVAEEKSGRGAPAVRRVQVTNQHLRDIDLVVGVERSLAGRVVFESDPGSRAVEKLSLAVRLHGDGLEDEEVRVKPDLGFEARDLASGPYRLAMDGLPEGAYFKRLRLSGRELPGPELELPEQGALTGVEAAVAFDGATVTGQVKDAPPGGATVILFPSAELPHYLVERSIKTDAAGKFTLGAVAPGAYVAFAAPAGTEAALEDPEVRRRHAARGVLLSLEAGEKRTVEVAALPAGFEDE